MKVSGDFAKKKRKCKYRRIRMDEKTRSSNGGVFYDFCGLRNMKCEEKNCIVLGGESDNGN